MYHPDFATAIDVDAEIGAMARYLAPRWEGFGDVAPLLRAIYAVTLRDAPLWFDDYPLYQMAEARRRRREQLLGAHLPVPAGAEAPKPAQYDAPTQLLAYLPLKARLLQECAMAIHGEWDFERFTRAAYRVLAADYPALAQARPVGWEALRRGYVDFAGMAEYSDNQQDADDAEFEGINSASAGTAGFTGRTALPYVMYDEVCQGRKAPYVLVSAAYGHFLAVIRHNNTVALLAALEALDLSDTAPQLVFDVPAAASGNALADTLLELVREDLGSADTLRQRHADALAAMAARATMSEEERAAQKAAAAGRIAEMLASLRSNRHDSDAEQREQDRQAKCLARLREWAGLAAPV
jgi:hypothetical protein